MLQAQAAKIHTLLIPQHHVPKRSHAVIALYSADEE